MKTLKSLANSIALDILEAKMLNGKEMKRGYPLGDGTYFTVHWTTGGDTTPENLWFTYLDVTGVESEPQQSPCDPSEPAQLAAWLDFAEEYINATDKKAVE